MWWGWHSRNSKNLLLLLVYCQRMFCLCCICSYQHVSLVMHVVILFLCVGRFTMWCIQGGLHESTIRALSKWTVSPTTAGSRLERRRTKTPSSIAKEQQKWSRQVCKTDRVRPAERIHNPVQIVVIMFYCSPKIVWSYVDISGSLRASAQLNLQPETCETTTVTCISSA